MIGPAIRWFPPAARSLGVDACAWWRAAGGRCFDWQEEIVVGILGLGADDRWVTSDDGVEVARQNGKGIILQIVEGFVAFELGHSLGYDVVMHTAHEFPTALEHQLRLEEIIQNAPHLHGRVRETGGYRHANGQESIRLKDGTRIVFKARTRGGGRGFSGDLLVWDEAMEVPDTVIAAQKPTLRASAARYGAKTIWAGSAVDETVHKDGVAFTRIRERGLERAPRVGFVGYQAPFEHPDELGRDDFANRDHWRAANPSMDEGLIPEETMADELATMPPRVAAVELLGVGARPDTSGDRALVISREAWEACEDPDSVLEPPYSLFWDVSPDRQTAIAIAGRNQAGRYHVELQEFRDGTRWAAGWIIERWRRSGHQIYGYGCDGLGPGSALAVELEEAGIDVDRFTSGDVAEACQRLVDLVAERELAHLGDAALLEAIVGATTRPLGQRWAWDRKSARTNIAPLVAVTGALGLAAGVATGPVVIY